MPVTMKDVARVAGVSLGTVSNYINGKASIQQKNKDAIEVAINKLGYEVNEVARNLKLKNSMTIGVIIPSFGNVFAVRTISYLERYFRVNHYSLQVTSYDNDPELLEHQIVALIGKKVDGLIIMPSVSLGENEVTKINASIDKKIPVVIFDSTGDGVRCDHIVLNNYNAFKEATKVLIGKGHQAIGLILGPEDVYSSIERCNGYMDALREMGLPVQDDLIVYTDYSKRLSKDRCKELLTRRPDIDGVVTAGYRITLGVLVAFNEKSLRVPEDISLLGFDSYEIANVLPYELTGISIPTKTVAQNITQAILDRIKDGFESPPVIRGVSMKYIEGKSIMKR